MAYDEGGGGGGRLSLKPPAVPKCPRSRGRMNKRRLFVSLATKEKKNEIKQQTHRKSDSPIGSLSVQVSRSAGVAMSVVYPVRRQMDSDDKKIGHKVPFQVYAVAFPFCSALRCYPENLKRDFRFIFARETTTNDDSKRIHVRIRKVCIRVKGSRPPRGSYRPPGLSVTINLLSANLLPFLVPFKIESFTLPLHSPYLKLTLCFQPAPLSRAYTVSLSNNPRYSVSPPLPGYISSLTESPLVATITFCQALLSD